MYLQLFPSPSALLNHFQSNYVTLWTTFTGGAQIFSDEGPRKTVNRCAGWNSRGFTRSGMMLSPALLCILVFHGRPTCRTVRVVSLGEKIHSVMFCIYTQKMVHPLQKRAIHSSSKILIEGR